MQDRFSSTWARSMHGFTQTLRNPLFIFSMTVGLLLSSTSLVRSQPAEPAPPAQLVDTLAQIDQAASNEDLDAVMQYFSPDFATTDGLTYETLQDSLSALWERFSNLQYTTTVDRWEMDGSTLIAETTTTINGVQEVGERTFNLDAQISSRQHFENGVMTQQEVLTESSQLIAGENPPTLDINLPEQVSTGQEFNFDAIVQEPLGDRYLLGSAMEEPVSAIAYSNPKPVDLELLSAGGLFKIGQAPLQSTDQWISAIVIRDDGINLTTRRLQVVEQN